jgi:hypothetical protein
MTVHCMGVSTLGQLIIIMGQADKWWPGKGRLTTGGSQFEKKSQGPPPLNPWGLPIEKSDPFASDALYPSYSYTTYLVTIKL